MFSDEAELPSLVANIPLGVESMLSREHSAHRGAPPGPMNMDNVAAISSIDTLLMNIQGLLKVAAENARHHEQQRNYETGTSTSRAINRFVVRLFITFCCSVFALSFYQCNLIMIR